ncbi:MAG: phosphodiester glycosidase family protein [Sandaracinaceae bacterium]
MRRRPTRARWSGLLAGAAALLSLVGGYAGAQVRPDTRAPIVVERIRAPIAPEVPIGDRIITLVRVDLSRYRLRIVTEEHDGQRRSVPQWVHDLHLAGAINAGMFLPNGRSVGFMMREGTVVSDRHVTKYRGVIGFGPRRAGAPELVVTGTGCGQTTRSVGQRYQNVLQAFEMVDCRGRPATWASRKRYSAAGLGVDREGRAVFMHTRTPYRMTVLDRMLADPALGIRGMIYMEGGPEASLFVDADGIEVSEVGSYETGFFENDSNREFWAVPNVIAFEAR